MLLLLLFCASWTLFNSLRLWATGERRLPGDLRGVHWSKEDVPAHTQAPPPKAGVRGVREDGL